MSKRKTLEQLIAEEELQRAAQEEKDAEILSIFHELADVNQTLERRNLARILHSLGYRAFQS